jgi:hypothetical protein
VRGTGETPILSGNARCDLSSDSVRSPLAVSSLEVGEGGSLDPYPILASQNPSPGDSAALPNNIGDPRHRHAQIHCQFVHAQPVGLEKIFAQVLAGMNRLQLLCHLHLPRLPHRAIYPTDASL